MQVHVYRDKTEGCWMQILSLMVVVMISVREQAAREI